MIPNLRHQSSCVSLETGSPAKSLSTKTVIFVNVFLSSESQRCFGVSHLIPCCTLQWNKVEFSRFTHPLGHMFLLFLQSLVCLGSNRESHMQAELYHVASCLFRTGLFLPSHTDLSCNFSRGVLTVFVFALHPDSLMMTGAVRLTVQELSSLISPNPEQRRRFASAPSIRYVPMSFAAYFDLRSVSM